MLGRGNGCFGFARVDHDDLRLAPVGQNALPEDWMRDAEIRADQDDDIRLFEVRIRVGRRVESKRLLVGSGGCGHALPRIAVAVHDAHSEFCESAEKGQFFSYDLAGAKPGHRSRAVLFLNGFEASGEFAQSLFPTHGASATRPIAQQWNRGAILGRERGQRFPAFRAGHAKVHGIIPAGRQVYRLAVAKMDIETASRGTETANAAGYGIRLESRGDAAEPKVAWSLHQFPREFAIPLPNEVWRATR